MELLGGVSTEVGRIGYVAATRARDLLWLVVPAKALKELRPVLEAKGFQEVAEMGAAKSKAEGDSNSEQPTAQVRFFAQQKSNKPREKADCGPSGRLSRATT